jgi:hypothetical protein
MRLVSTNGARLLRICGASGFRIAARFNNSNNFHNSNNAARIKAAANKMSIQTNECGAAAGSYRAIYPRSCTAKL